MCVCGGALGTSWVEAGYAAHCPTGHGTAPTPENHLPQVSTVRWVSRALHSSMCDVAPYRYWNQRPMSAGDHCGFYWYLGQVLCDVIFIG